MYFLPYRRNIRISNQQWQYVSGPIQSDPGSPEAEREKLKEVTRRWELVLASKIGSGFDVGGWAGNLLGMIPLVSTVTGQTNCNDETTNNISLLQTLQTAGYLRHHYIDPAQALATVAALHQAVLLKERKSGTAFVLDSWPMGNGQLPLIQKEEDWNFLTLLPFNNLPTTESLSQSHPLHKIATVALGLGASTLFARRGIGKHTAALTAAMPETQVKEVVASTWGQRLKVGRHRQALEHGYVPPLDFQKPAIQDYYAHLLPKDFVGPRINRWYFGILQSSSPINNPIRIAAQHYFMSPKGALNFAAAALLATEIVVIPWTINADGISKNAEENSPSVGERLSAYAGAIYLGAEGATALRLGTTPLLYELPVAALPALAGSIACTAVAHEIGARADIPSLQYGGRGNTIIGIAGGAAAVAGAKRFVGQNVWQATVQNVERIVVENTGRAGLWIEGMVQNSVRFASQEGLPALIGLATGLGRFFTPILIPNPDKLLNPNFDKNIEA